MGRMPISRTLVGLVLALSLSGCAATIELGETKRSVAEACEALVLDYAYHRDRLDAQAVAQLFTPGAVMIVQGQTFVGREAIFDRLAAPNQPVTQHLMSTIRIFPGGPDEKTATGVSYASIYLAPANPDGGPASVRNITAVGEYRDEFRLTDEGWKIARREFVVNFVPES